MELGNQGSLCFGRVNGYWHHLVVTIFDCSMANRLVRLPGWIRVVNDNPTWTRTDNIIHHYRVVGCQCLIRYFNHWARTSSGRSRHRHISRVCRRGLGSRRLYSRFKSGGKHIAVKHDGHIRAREFIFPDSANICMQHGIHHRSSLARIYLHNNILIVATIELRFTNGIPYVSIHLVMDHHPAWPLAESIRDHYR